MKITDTTFNGFDFNKCYPGYDPEQYSKEFSCWSDILDNAFG